MKTPLSDLLRQQRLASGLTQAELAERAGISEQAISLLERGARSRPRRSTVEGLAAAMNLAPDAARALVEAAGTGRPGAPPPAQPTETVAVRTPVPWQLPPAVADFTARAEELDKVLATLRSDEISSRLVTVTGMGGVGKTALAVQAGHQSAQQFPDGQLYIKLRGYDQDAALSPAEALGQLLRSLHVQPEAIPSSVDEMAAMYRSLIAGRRILLLLDDANSIDQVTPLLPGDPGCATIITSRRFLATLPGNRIVRLSAMAEGEALLLLSALTGAQRVAAEGEAARDIVRLTGGLPLAVRLVGARLAARPNWQLQDIVDQLNDEHRRLDGLGLDHSGVRASFAGSLNELLASPHATDHEAVRAFDLLSLAEGSEISLPLVTRFLDRGVSETEALLERLVDLHLLDSIGARRYRVHDLLRSYGAERLATPDRRAERDAAIERGLTLYLAAAWRVHRITHPWSTRHPAEEPNETGVPPFAEMASALRWIDTEFDSMIDLYRRAAVIPGWQERFGPSLALGLFGYLEARAYWSKMRLVYDLGLMAVDPRKDPSTAGWLEHDRAIPDVEEGKADDGRIRVLRSFALFEQAGDAGGMARGCSTLSHIYERLDLLDEAIVWGERGLALSLKIGDSAGAGTNYLALGILYQRTGRPAQAARAYQASFRAAEADGNYRSLARRRRVAAGTYILHNQFDEAVEHITAAIGYFRQLNDPSGLAEALEYLSSAELALGRHKPAEDHAWEAHGLAETYHDTFRQANVLALLATIKDAVGDRDQATTLRRRAIQIFETTQVAHAADALRALVDRRD